MHDAGAGSEVGREEVVVLFAVGVARAAPGALEGGRIRSLELAPAVVAAADDALTARGVDLVVSNQLHPAWCGALADAGYELGPSNFFFYSSEALREALSGQPEWENGIHMNRGDGEGPGHL